MEKNYRNSSVKKVTFSVRKSGLAQKSPNKKPKSNTFLKDKKKKMTKNELFRRVPIDELDMEEIAPEISEDDAPRYTALSQNKDPDCYKKILSPEFFSEEMINSQDQAEPEESNIPSLEDCLSMML